MFGDDEFDSEDVDARNKYGQTRLYRAAKTGKLIG